MGVAPIEVKGLNNNDDGIKKPNCCGSNYPCPIN